MQPMKGWPVGYAKAIYTYNWIHALKSKWVNLPKKKPNLSWDHNILELGLGWTVNSTLDRPQINRQISETSWDQFLNLWFRSELPMNSKILDNDPGECGSTGNLMNGGLLVKPRSQRQASESRKPSYGFSNPWWIYPISICNSVGNAQVTPVQISFL